MNNVDYGILYLLLSSSFGNRSFLRYTTVAALAILINLPISVYGPVTLGDSERLRLSRCLHDCSPRTLRQIACEQAYLLESTLPRKIVATVGC